MPIDDSDILGTTVEIQGAQSAMDILSAQAAASGEQPASADVDAILDDQDALAGAESPVVGSNRPRRRSPDVAFREQQRNEAAAERARAARERANREALRTEAVRRRNAPGTAADRVASPYESPDRVFQDANYDEYDPGYTPRMSDSEYRDDLERMNGAYWDRIEQRARPSSRVAQLEDDLSPYQRNVQMRRDLEMDLRNRYTETGRFSEIGSKDYLAEREEMFQSVGLGSLPKEPPVHGRGMSMDVAMSIGFGGMATIGAIQNAYHPAFAGESYLPGQAAEQAASGALPLMGALLGTGIGMRFGGMGGGLAGQFVGQSLGAGLQDLTDTYLEGHNFTQQRAGQSLGEGRGGADAIQEFTDALRNAATPAAKELADSLTKLGQSGPVSPQAASQFGTMQFALGTNFAPATEGVARFLDSTPGLASVRSAFGTGPTSNLSRDDYLGVAGVAAMRGDYGGMKDALTYAEANNVNPQYAKDKDFVDRYSGWSPSAIWNRSWKSLFYPSRMDAFDKASERLKTESQFLTDPKALQSQEQEIRDSFERHADNIADVMAGGARMAVGQGDLQRAMIYGGDGSTIRRMAPGITAAANAQIDALRADSALDRQLADKYAKTNPALAREYRMSADSNDARSAQLSAVGPTMDRSAFELDQQAETAAFGLTQSRLTADILTGQLSGLSYSQMQGSEDRLLSATRSYASQQRQDAKSKFYSPAERDAVLAQAQSLETEAAQQAYSFRMADYAQRVGQTDLGIQKGQFAVQQAQLYAGPEAFGSAFSQEADAYQAKIRELSEELKRGGLTLDDRIKKEGELNSTRASAAALASQEARSFYGAQGSIDASRIGVSANDAVMSGLTGGSGAAVGSYEKERQMIAAARATQLARSTDPRLSQQEREDALNMVSSFDVSDMRTLMNEARFSAAPGAATREIELRGSLNRASYSFLEPGNVNDMRSRLFGQINQNITAYDKQIQDRFGGNVPDYLQPIVAEERNRLLDERAQVGSQMDRHFFDRLPAITMGAPSFEARYLPSAAQAAMMTEQKAPTLAAANFGFFKQSSGAAMMGEVGSLGTTAGMSAAQTQPGNLSVQALATAFEQALRKVMRESAASSAASPTGAMQQNAANTRGLSGLVPGM